MHAIREHRRNGDLDARHLPRPEDDGRAERRRFSRDRRRLQGGADGHAAYTVADEAELTLLGYIAFLDPPKETAGPAIATLKERGVQVKILTGDNDIVTRKICHDVGLPVDISFLAMRSRD